MRNNKCFDDNEKYYCSAQIYLLSVLFVLTVLAIQPPHMTVMVGCVHVDAAAAASSSRSYVIPRKTRRGKTNSSNNSNKQKTQRQPQQVQLPPDPATKFFQYKCGGGDSSINNSNDCSDSNYFTTTWVYTGSLMDPYTGQLICNVQGIELIQPIGCHHAAGSTSSVVEMVDNNDPSSSSFFRGNHNDNQQHQPPTPVLEEEECSFQRYKRRCRNLQIVPIVEQYYNNQNHRHDHNHDPQLHGGDTSPDGIRQHQQQQRQQRMMIQSNTMVSRKLFCYTPPTTTVPVTKTNSQDRMDRRSSNDFNHPNMNQRLLTTFRRTSNVLGPITHIPFDQVITCYDSIVSSISLTEPPPPPQSRNDPSPVSSSSSSSSWWLHTEFPSTATRNKQPTSIWSEVDHSISSSSGDESHRYYDPHQEPSKTNNMLDFSIFTRRRSIPLRVFAPPTQIETVSSISRNSIYNTTVTSKSRRPWIQFGNSGDRSGSGSSSSSRMNELGVRESYQYYTTSTTNTASDTCNKVRYTRYGEAPVWYGPGRVCLLELIGTRISQPRQHVETVLQRSRHSDINDNDDSNFRDHTTIVTAKQLVPIASSIISQYIPNFWNINLQERRSLNNRLTSTTTSKAKRRMNNNDKSDINFLYYAQAIHPGLTMHEEKVFDPHDSNNNNHHQKKLPTTENEYRRHYNDLTIGRQIQQLLLSTSSSTKTKPLLQQQLMQMMEHDRVGISARRRRQQQIAKSICDTVLVTWDKLRSASTLSIW